jgi:5,10-methylenetetrahydromethanopterin reductase
VTAGARELGLGLQTDKRPGEYAALARIAEGGGFDVVTTFNDLWCQPALPALLEIAGATERVRVGPSCLDPYLAHPVELAGQTAALDLASPGRAFLGLAAGAWLGGLEIEQRRPVAAVAEAWEIVSRLLAGDRSGFEGEIFRLEPGAGLAYPPERKRVPLLVGTWSPRLTALAAEKADELKLGGTVSPAMVRLARERLGSAMAGERLGSAGVGIVAGAVTVVDHDGGGLETSRAAGSPCISTSSPRSTRRSPSTRSSSPHCASVCRTPTWTERRPSSWTTPSTCSPSPGRRRRSASRRKRCSGRVR